MRGLSRWDQGSVGLFFGPFRAVREYRVARFLVVPSNHSKPITNYLEDRARPVCAPYSYSVDWHYSWLFCVGEFVMRSSLSIALVALGGLLMFACGGSDSGENRGGGGTGGTGITLDCPTLDPRPADCDKGCTSSAQCEASFCDNGQCVAHCTATQGCGANSTCNVSGRCVPNMNTGGTGGTGNTGGGTSCLSVSIELATDRSHSQHHDDRRSAAAVYGLRTSTTVSNRWRTGALRRRRTDWDASRRCARSEMALTIRITVGRSSASSIPSREFGLTLYWKRSGSTSSDGSM